MRKRFLSRLGRAWWWIVGLVLLGAGLFAIVNDIPPLNVLWYAFGWYGYLLVLDAVIFALQGRSFISHRRHELVTMMFWSAAFWFIFEAYNLVIQNWYYVYALRSDLWQGVFAWVAFATVFPACFFHYELLRPSPWFDRKQWHPIDIHAGLKQFFLWFGALCIIIPVFLPRYGFWMVWGALLGVPDYLNYRNGASSILGDLEQGRPGRLFRLLLGGLLAGFVWEGLNFWARCKWIYTVPGLEEFKLFEMPVLGFLGFPVLAVEAFAAYTLFNHYFRNGRRWELSEVEQPRRKRNILYFVIVGVAIVFNILAYIGVVEYSLKSRRALFSEMEGLSSTQVDSLHGADIFSPGHFFKLVNNRGVEPVSQLTGIPPDQIQQMQNLLSLALHKGMGVPSAKLLQRAGINNITQLRSADAREVYQKMVPLAASQGYDPPRLVEVQVWIRAVRFAGGTKR